MSEPVASRPQMPAEYGVAGPAAGEGLLPWTWAAERLTKSRHYWLATTRPDGRPHVMIVWGVWLGDRFFFSTSPKTVKARNLQANPNCVVCAEQAEEPVVVEGVAERVGDAALIREILESYCRKYEEDFDPTENPVYGLRPVVAFGFYSQPEKWAETATRWRFTP